MVRPRTGTSPFHTNLTWVMRLIHPVVCGLHRWAHSLRFRKDETDDPQLETQNRLAKLSSTSLEKKKKQLSSPQFHRRPASSAGLHRATRTIINERPAGFSSNRPRQAATGNRNSLVWRRGDSASTPSASASPTTVAAVCSNPNADAPVPINRVALAADATYYHQQRPPFRPSFRQGNCGPRPWTTPLCRRHCGALSPHQRSGERNVCSTERVPLLV